MNGPRTAAQIAGACRRGALSPLSATRDALRRLDHVEGTIDALVHVDSERALDRAAQLAKNGPPASGEGLLFGVPIAVKDNICIEGVPTTCGSRMLPWSPELSPGGSSGGSAALVGSGALPAALGSDTGGSIRQPAALCGAVGFKPTYGTVSRYGLVAFGSSFDQIGPLSATVGDGALLFQAIGGFDRRDSTSIPGFVPDVIAGLDDGIDTIRIGVPRELMGEGIDRAVVDAVRASLERIEKLGASVVPIDLPHAEYALCAYYVAAMSEASSNLARFDGVRYGLREERESMARTYAATRNGGFGREVKMRIMLGTFALSAGYFDDWYAKALRARRLVAADFEKAFQEVDLVVAPTSPLLSIGIGEKIDDPLAMYHCDALTVPASLAGLPALSVPCALSPSKGSPCGRLPIGLQIMGPPLADALVLRAGHAVELTRPEKIVSPLAKDLEEV